MWQYNYSYEELYHYGVKGMKWGIRKKRYKSSYDSDTVLKKGTTIQNISANKKRDLDKGPVYGATTKRDKLQYASMYAEQLKDIQDAKNIYINDLKVVKDIKIPSQKKAVEMFKETFVKDSDGMARCIARCKADMSLFGKMGKIVKMDTESRVYRQYMNKGEEWLETKGYEYFNQSITNNKSVKARNAYFDTLLSKGYGGVLDVNDINNSYNSEAPVIVIDPKNSLKEGTTKKLSQKEIGLSMMKYAELYEPNLMSYAEACLED